jgi:hypothetical protein
MLSGAGTNPMCDLGDGAFTRIRALARRPGSTCGGRPRCSDGTPLGAIEAIVRQGAAVYAQKQLYARADLLSRMREWLDRLEAHYNRPRDIRAKKWRDQRCLMS